jgi:hypothetical protein
VALGTPGLADLRRASRSGTGSRADIGRAEKPPDRGKKSNTAPNGDGQVLRRAGLSGVWRVTNVRVSFSNRRVGGGEATRALFVA